MTRSPLADLLQECDSLGIAMRLDGRGGLTLDGPRDALTSDFIERVRQHKPELVAMLQRNAADGPRFRRSAGDWVRARLAEHVEFIRRTYDVQNAGEPICGRCHSREFCDVPIHGGRSVRRDCAQCGLTIDLPVWNPEGANQ